MTSMKSKKKLLKSSRLYVIIDKEVSGNRSVLEIVKKIKHRSVDIVQFRDKKSNKRTILKDSLALFRELKKTKTAFIINDYLDIAKIVDCDGVHLGQQDTSIEIARKILGKDKIIGVSCHNLRQAWEAQERGADYISIGPLFPTPIKPGYKAIGLNLINEIKNKIKIPFFAIGGINESNLDKVLSWQAKRIALCRAVCQAKNISLAIKKLSEDILDTTRICS